MRLTGFDSFAVYHDFIMTVGHQNLLKADFVFSGKVSAFLLPAFTKVIALQK